MKNHRAILLLVLLGAVTPLLLQAQTTESYTFTTNRMVTDGNAAGLSDVRNLGSAIGTITSVSVRLKLTGEFNGDMYAYLRHTNGLVVLLNRVGKTAANSTGYPDSGFNVTFQTGAANGDIHSYQTVTTPSAGSPLTGIWQPDGRTVDPTNVTDLSARSTSLTNFNGLNAAGEWALYLVDVESGGTNQLTEWGLNITGAASPTLTWTNPANIVYGTPLSGTQLNATAIYNGTNVPGTFTYTPASGAVLNAGLARSLSVTFTPNDTTSFLPVSTSVSINVTPAPLTITANSTSKTYGQTVTFSGTEFTTTGLTNGNTVTNVTLTSSGAAATATVAGSPYSIVPSVALGSGLGNYTITYANGTLTVGTAALTITANSTSKVYGTTKTFAGTEFTTSGLLNSDSVTSVSLTSAGAATTATVAGSPYSIVPSAAAGSGLGNYTITYANGSLTVGTAALTITAYSTSKVYGTTKTFAGTEFTTSGLLNSDTVTSVTLTSAGAVATATVAGSTYSIVPSAAVGSGLGNYTITYANGSLTVGTAALTITANSTSKVYGTTKTFAGTEFTTSGLLNSDTVTSVTLTSVGAAATATVAGSPYSIVPSAAVGSGLGNYTITYANGTLTVGTAALTLTANSTSKVYGTTKTFAGTEFTTSGLLNSDSVTSVTLTSAGAAATATVAGSPYSIVPSAAVGSGMGNYTITYANGSLTIGTATLTVTANNQSKAYGAALPTFTATYNGFANGDTTNNLTALASVTTTATPTSNVGTYPITATGAVDANYSFTYVGSLLTVTQSLTTGFVSSTANPAVPGTSVTFSMTLAAVLPGVGTPSGTVNFRIDGSIAGSGTLSGGVATYTTSSLTHGNHTVAAEYAGDLNFVGVTNSLAPNEVINTPPVAGSYTLQRYPTQGVKVRLATLLANASDADGDTLTMSVTNTSVNGGTITINGAWAFYTPAAGYTNADSFTYTVTDGQGGSATGTITVAIQVDAAPGQNLVITALGGSSYLISGSGIPGRTYRMQYTDSLTPANWLDFLGGSVTPDSTGAFQYTDPSGNSNRYYRSVYP